MFTPASFVVAAMKELGIFHGIDVNASEFTVKDIYELAIFEKDFHRPYLCVEADERLPFCQLFGTTRLELPRYNSVAPYARMNEQCPNHFENTKRPAAC